MCTLSRDEHVRRHDPAWSPLAAPASVLSVCREPQQQRRSVNLDVRRAALLRACQALCRRPFFLRVDHPCRSRSTAAAAHAPRPCARLEKVVAASLPQEGSAARRGRAAVAKRTRAAMQTAAAAGCEAWRPCVTAASPKSCALCGAMATTRAVYSGVAQNRRVSGVRASSGERTNGTPTHNMLALMRLRA